MISDTDLTALEALAAQVTGHWRVCDDLLQCGTSGVFHLLLERQDGTACAAAASEDVLDEDRTRLVYLAAAANLAPRLAAELRVLRVQLAGAAQKETEP